MDLRKFEPYGAAAFEGHPKPHTHNKQPHYGVVGCGVAPPVVQIGPAKAVGLGRKEAKPDPKLSRRLRRRPSPLGYLLHRPVVDAFTYITHAGTNYISRRKYRLTHHRQQQEARKEATLLATCLVSRLSLRRDDPESGPAFRWLRCCASSKSGTVKQKSILL